MRKLKGKKILSLTIMLFLLSIILISFTACSSGNDTGEETSQDEVQEEKGTLVLADPQWDSALIHNSITQFILEEGYGYKTEIISASSAAILTGFESGDIDIHMEAWVQNMPEQYFEFVDSGVIVELSTNYNDNAQGFYVPTYVIEGDSERGIEAIAPDLKTVEDLANYPEIFQDEEDPSKGRIYGVPPAWIETAEIFTQKYETYGLDEMYTYFSPGSDTGLSASLGGAYQAGEPWVGYYWEPTWVTGLYDLTLLEEAPYSDELWENGNACTWPAVDVDVVVYKDVEEEAPEVVEFLSNYETSSQLTSDALGYMQDNDADADEAALWFLQEYEDVWTSWVPEDIAEKVKVAL